MSCGWVKRGVNVRFVSRLMLGKGGSCRWAKGK